MNENQRSREHMERMWAARRRSAALKRYQVWITELEEAGYTVIPPGDERATEPAEVSRISA